MTLPAPVRRNLLLLVVCLAQLMVVLDVSIVNVALPSIRHDLGYSTTGLQWVVNAYTLTFAGFLLLGGRAADLLGRRRVFLAGTVLFTLASLLCAVADSQATLDGARALQGFGAAIISPATLAILTTSFTEGRERNRALAAWGAMGGLGGAVGVLLGGVLTQGRAGPRSSSSTCPSGSWSSPPACASCPRARPSSSTGTSTSPARSSSPSGSRRWSTGSCAPTPRVGRDRRARADRRRGSLLIAAFAFVEGRVAKAPLMPARLVRLGQLRAANLVVFLLFAAVFTMWFFVSLYLQQVLGLDALETGLAFLPMTLGIVAVTTQTPKLIARFGPGRVLAVGRAHRRRGHGASVRRARGRLLRRRRPPRRPARPRSASGWGSCPAPSSPSRASSRATAAWPPALLNSSRLVGGALGLAVLSTIAASQTSDRLASGTSQAGRAQRRVPRRLPRRRRHLLRRRAVSPPSCSAARRERTRRPPRSSRPRARAPAS